MKQGILKRLVSSQSYGYDTEEGVLLPLLKPLSVHVRFLTQFLILAFVWSLRIVEGKCGGVAKRRYES